MTRSHDDQASHQQVWELLAWYVNGSATPAQKRIVDAHLPHCDACRDEHAAQRRLHELISRESVAVPDPEPGLARLMGDLDRPAPGHAAQVRAQPPQGVGRRLKYAVAALATLALLEGAALAMLGLQRADYQTLSSAQPEVAPQATIRMVPAPAMSVKQLHALLRRLELQIVAGPTEAGVYSLAPQGAPDTPAALAGLRATSDVLFAEPVGEGR